MDPKREMCRLTRLAFGGLLTRAIVRFAASGTTISSSSELTPIKNNAIKQIFSTKKTAQIPEWLERPPSGAVDSGSIPGRVKSMTLKLVFTASLLDVQH